MFVLYLDELGHDGVWDPDDPKHAHHPLFGLAGIALPGDRCRDLDRGYLKLKCSFYQHEVDRYRAEGKRVERFEPKELRNRRDERFTRAVFDLVSSLEGTAFVFAVEKEIAKRHGDELYGRVAHGVLESFEKFLRKKAGKRWGSGAIILDRRGEKSDVTLLSWMQSYLFRESSRFERIVETPLLVRSEWYHGVQAADTVARAAGKIFRYRVIGDQACKGTADRLSAPLHALQKTDGPWSTIYLREREQEFSYSVSEPTDDRTVSEPPKGATASQRNPE